MIASPAGNDLLFDESTLEQGRNFNSKLWNATKLLKMWEPRQSQEGPIPEDAAFAMDWFQAKLSATQLEVDEMLKTFRLSEALKTIYGLIWDDYCSWYLEWIKPGYEQPIHATVFEKSIAFYDDLLQLLHPFMPFITEELWCNLTGGPSLMIADWPKSELSSQDQGSVELVNKMQEIVTEIRRFRNDQGIKSTAKISAKFTHLDKVGLAEYEASLRHILKCDDKSSNFTAKTQIGQVIVEFDLTGAIDLVAERSRLTKDLQAAKKDRDTAKIKLDNEGFMAKAPMEVVSEIRLRLTQTSEDIERLTALLEKLPK
jgi:valyl-tRNA synthetase